MNKRVALEVPISRVRCLGLAVENLLLALPDPFHVSLGAPMLSGEARLRPPPARASAQKYRHAHLAVGWL